MRILVTGGNGFLGSWIVKRLVEEQHQVRVLHRAHSDLSSLNGLTFESALGDVTNLESLFIATRDIEAVFHVAGLVSYSPLDFKLMEAINVKGTANVIEACVKARVPRLIFTSSVVAVGATEEPQNLNETSPYTLQKYNLGYYETKRRAENLVIEASKNKIISGIILNPGVMFGAGDAVKGSRKTHLKVIQGKFPFYPPGGINVLHVDDAVSAHISALKNGRSGERYILGGDNLAIHRFFEMLAQAGGHKPPAIGLPSWFLHGASNLSRALKLKGASDSYLISTLYHFYDSTKARKELGFSARPAMTAIEESVAWSRANGFLG
jgi:dihydroflavonol-4-reductase